MIFAFFLGAGNMIFPPWAGQQAGENLWQALFGFLLTDVGLSLGAILVVLSVGSPDGLTRDLPPSVSRLFWIAIYLVIGPLFAVPRTAVVAWEVGSGPWLQNSGSGWQAVHSGLFFVLVALLCIVPGRLVTVIGKILTPLLVIILAALYVAMLLLPVTTLGPPMGAWQEHALLEGAIQGYQTMDALGALAFGLTITLSIRAYGIKEDRDVMKYGTRAALIAGACLCLVYVGLFYLGAISRELLPTASHGGEILIAMVNHLLGGPGLLLLSLAMVLACLTTAIGVTTSCAHYFQRCWPAISYRCWVALFSLTSMIVANVGLADLLKVSVPVVITLYPLAIVIVFLGATRTRIRLSKRWVHIALLSTLMVSTLSGLSAAELLGPFTDIARHIPLFDRGLGWLLPAATTIIAGGCLDASSRRSLTRKTTEEEMS